MAKDTDYSRLDLFIPRTFHEAHGQWVGSQPGKAFTRQIDLWWAGLLIGVSRRQRTPFATNNKDARVKFNDASILTTDDWRIPQMELIALAESGSDTVKSAQAVVDICQEYANTGLAIITEALTGEPQPAVTFLMKLPALMNADES